MTNPAGTKSRAVLAYTKRTASTPGVALAEPWFISTARYVLYLILFFHFVSLTGYTSNLDEIKRIAMWVGGSACMIIACALIATQQVKLPPMIILFSFLAFMLTKLISLLLAEPIAHWIGWEEMRNWYATAGVLFLASLTHTNRRAGLESLLFFCVLSLVLCLFGIIHYVGLIERFVQKDITEDNTFQLVLLTLAQQPEMFSLIFNTQFFGNVLIYLLPLTLCMLLVFPIWQFKSPEKALAEKQAVFFLDQQRMLLGIMGLISFFLICFCIPLTYSKITLISTPVGILILYFGLPLIAKISPIKVPYWPLFLFFLLLNVLTLYPFIKHDIATRFSTIENSTDSRLILWDGAWQMFLKSPIVGMGTGSYRIYFPEFRSPDYHLSAISNVTLSAHNWFFDALGQNGLLGTVAILFYFGATAWTLIRAAATSVSLNRRMICLAYLGGILAFLTACLATPMFSWPVGLMSFGALAGIATGVASRDWDDQESPRGGNWQFPFGVVAGCLSLLLFFNMYTWSSNYFISAVHHRAALQLSTLPAEVEQGLKPEQIAYRIKVYSQSIEAFEKVHKLNPSYITSYYRRANVENQLGNSYKALFSETAKANVKQINQPEVQKTLLSYAQAFIKYQDNALEQYRTIQKYAPDYSELHNNIGILESSKTKFEREVFSLLNPNQKPTSEQIKSWRDSYNRAIESMERATNYSNKISVWNMQGIILQEAADLYTGSEPEREVYLTKAANSFLRTAQLPLTEATQEANQRVLEAQIRLYAAQNCISTFIKAQAWGQVGEAAETLLPLYPSIPEFSLLGAEAFVKSGNPKEASEFLQAQILRNPTNPDLYLLRLRLAEVDKSFAELNSITDQIKQVEQIKSLIPEFFTEKQQQVYDRIVIQAASKTPE